MDNEDFSDSPKIQNRFLVVPITVSGMMTLERWVQQQKQDGFRIGKRWSVRDASGGVVSHSMLVEMVKNEE